jgi:DNA (cytosine-5)-methyltransferase 1
MNRKLPCDGTNMSEKVANLEKKIEKLEKKVPVIEYFKNENSEDVISERISTKLSPIESTMSTTEHKAESNIKTFCVKKCINFNKKITKDILQKICDKFELEYNKDSTLKSPYVILLSEYFKEHPGELTVELLAEFGVNPTTSKPVKKITPKSDKKETIDDKNHISYGEIARLNGIEYEQKVFESLTDLDTLQKIHKYVPLDLNNKFRTELISNKKVDSIHSKKTTSKCDMILYQNDMPITFSVKMSNKGAQFQIVSLDIFLQYLSYKNINFDEKVVKVWKKFLGIDIPNDDELKILNEHRSEKLKNTKRYWLNELSKKDQFIIELFIAANKYELLEFCLMNGLCLEPKNIAQLFILNKHSYTETKIIDFEILDYKDLIKKIGKGVPKITKNGNLQLSNYIGIQRKGSGDLSSKNCIQFKDRGLDKIINVKQNNEKLRGLSLFACSGIAEYYIDKTKLEIVLANELLKERCEIYNHFHPHSKMIQGDINEKFDKLISESKRLDINFIMATPPCQSFSNAGRKELKDKRTPLFMPLIKAIQEIKPKYCLIENVPTFMASKYEEKNDETIYEKFVKELGDMYIINTKILNTKDYEVPQSRKRSITLLSLKTEPEWKHPKSIDSLITVRDAIGHLPSLKSGEESNVHKWHKARIHNDNHIKWMSYTPSGKTAFENKVNFPQKDGRRIKGYNTTYKRIDWDKPSPTITMSSGSISSQNNVHPGTLYEEKGEILYDNARALTIYEIMLLTGLDDNWDPPTTSEKIIRDIIGEAVPPKLIYHIVNVLPKH